MCASGVCLCACVYLPLGGGLMSASPCWLELSDCPDSTQKDNKSLVCCFAIKCFLLKNKGSSWLQSPSFKFAVSLCVHDFYLGMFPAIYLCPPDLMYNDLLCSAMLFTI